MWQGGDVNARELATEPLPPARPAATVIVARESSGEFEILLLKRSEIGAFAGMWVFPGGRVEDNDVGHDDVARAAAAAVREAHEEVAVSVQPDTLIALSHWTPPAIAPKRYTTWFFVAPWAGDDVQIDNHEIVDARWIRPADAIANGLPMAPPTHVTLVTLDQAGSFSGLRGLITERGVERFVTVPAQHDGTLVLLWENDAGYDSADASIPGSRHRMVMRDGRPLTYERSTSDSH